MTKLEILANQIHTDSASLVEDLEQGMSGEDVIKDVIRLNEKVSEWGIEAHRIMDEAKGTDSLVEDLEK